MAKQIEAFYAADRKAWRGWLSKNHKRVDCVWLIIYKKDSSTPTVYYGEAVEEALCFGWIDSKPNKRDGKSYVQFFARRKPKSGWSKINKERIALLIKQKRMTSAGLKAIEEAKTNGSWTALDAIERYVMPPDLSKAFSRNKIAKSHFGLFPPSVKKAIYYWIQSACLNETRKKRVLETVALAARNVRANEWRQK